MLTISHLSVQYQLPHMLPTLKKDQVDFSVILPISSWGLGR